MDKLNPNEIVLTRNVPVLDGELIFSDVSHEKAAEATFREKVIAALAAFAFIGLLLLAFVDRDYRPAFVSFAYAFLGAYVGVQVTKTDS